ncbi:hypothetical protein [Rubrolithibacter danxiaensis]|uniref:hypothetical protein n=1 Tax=Rubrolithibacter danxiaensis TaxID=3390805 RepID=UPI003BF9153A
MATHKIHSSTVVPSVDTTINLNLVKRFNAFADSQENWTMAWWISSLIIIGGFFLPVTFLLVYSFGGPVVPFLAISLVSFFASIITNMGSMGIRANVFTSCLCVALHLSMILITLIVY